MSTQDKRMGFTSNRVFFTKRPTSVSKLCRQKKVESVFSPLNTYLWIHGVGFTSEFRGEQKNLIVITASIVLVIICEGSFIFAIQEFGCYVYKSDHTMSKEHISAAIILIANTFVRIIFYCRRNAINSLIRQFGILYGRVKREDISFNEYKLQMKLSIILLINDLYTFIICVIFFSAIPSSTFLGSLGDSYHYGMIPPPYSTPIFYVIMFLLRWCNMNMAVSGYFCCICILLKETLKYTERKLHQAISEGTDYLFENYIEITSFIRFVTTQFHVILLTKFTAILIELFHEMYHVLFTVIDSRLLLTYRLLNIIFELTHFIAICIFSSSVSDAASAVRNEAQRLITKVKSLENLKFAFAMSDEFVGFKIFNSIVIGKSLILSAIGTLLTYGMLIASLNANK